MLQSQRQESNQQPASALLYNDLTLSKYCHSILYILIQINRRIPYGQKAERIKLALGLNKSIQEEVLVYNVADSC